MKSSSDKKIEKRLTTLKMSFRTSNFQDFGKINLINLYLIFEVKSMD